LSCRPQWSQKRAASGKSALQNGQLGKSQNPQRLQNRASARFSVWQLEQRYIVINYVLLLYQIFSSVIEGRTADKYEVERAGFVRSNFF
jgi:hypothetical protein